jgi:hypothetical protein
VRKSLSQKTQPMSAGGVAAAENPASPASITHATAASGQSPDSRDILAVLKEELFQLESDRLHEKISQREYETSKAGLDALIRRHVKQAGRP